MSELRIVGLSGYKRSGKDTAGRALTGRGWERRSFADYLRGFLHALNPIIPHPHGGDPVRLATYVDVLGWEAAKDQSEEVRALLQRAGTDAGRRVLGPNVWVDAATRCMSADAPGYVFTDVRFPNEVDAIRDKGGIVVRIDRPGFTAPAGAHESETALDGYRFDQRLINDGTEKDLRRQVLDVVTRAWPAAA